MSKQYPPAQWFGAHPNNYSYRKNNPELIVVHVIQGSWRSAINWFQNPRAGVSAHYEVASDGSVAQSVGDLSAAYHAGNWYVNSHSIGIEHGGYVEQPAYFTDEMIHASAKLVAYKCKQFGIPVDRNHILAHSQIRGTTHTDPGPHWPWARYINLIRRYRSGKGDGGGSPPTPDAGYRVQSYALSNETKAREVVDVMRDDEIPTSLAFDSPLWKVQNGWFGVRENAAHRRDSVRDKGYPAALIRTGISSVTPDPVDDIEAAMNRAFKALREMLGAFYATWKTGDGWRGSPIWGDRLPTVTEARRQGGVCSAVLNIACHASGVEPPTAGGFTGGTGAWGVLADRIGEPFDGRGENLRPLDIVGSKYRGASLPLQGHVVLITGEGLPREAQTIQWLPDRGLHESRTVAETNALLSNASKFEYIIRREKLFG